MPRLKICALGNSYASGAGLMETISYRAMQSKQNYPHVLAEKLDADLVDLTCAGALLKNILHTPRWAWGIFPPQLAGLPADTDIVTITAGDDDMGYMTDVMKVTYEMLLDEEIPLNEWTTMNHMGRPTMAQVACQLVEIIDAVRAKAPRATIYLVEHVHVFGPFTTREDTPLSVNQLLACMQLEDRLNWAFGVAAHVRPGTVLVPMGQMSRGHELGSINPWVVGFRQYPIFRFESPWARSFRPHATIRSSGFLSALLSLLSCVLELIPLRPIVPYQPNLEAHARIAAAIYKDARRLKRDYVH